MNNRKITIEEENSEDLSQLLDFFLLLEKEQNLNEKTLTHHSSVLKRFVATQTADTIRENCIKEIELFFLSCSKRTAMSEFTRKSYFNVIKKFMIFLRQRGIVDERVVELIEAERLLLPDVKPFFFEPDDELKLFESLKKKPKKRGSEVFERNVMILKLLRYGGLRPEEVREVRINDIYDNGRSYFHIPIGKRILLDENSSMSEDDLPEVVVPMSLIKKELGVLMSQNYNYLCEAPKSKRRLTTDELGNMSKNYQRRAGVEKPLGLMAYRHTYAKELCYKKIELDTIRRKLRLSSKRAVVNYYNTLKIPFK